MKLSWMISFFTITTLGVSCKVRRPPLSDSQFSSLEPNGTQSLKSWRDIPEAYRNYAPSLAIILPSYALKTKSTNNESYFSIETTPLENEFPVCNKTEKFPAIVKVDPKNDYPFPPNCGGFLIGPQHAMTAGHCASPYLSEDCTQISLVFGYTGENQDINKNQVYRCKKVLTSAFEFLNGDGLDYAVIELDRPVENAKAIPLVGSNYSLSPTEETYTLMGYPMGMPLQFNQVSSRAILSPNNKYFSLPILHYDGHSGSPILNQKGKVIGIFHYSTTEDPGTCVSLTRKNKDILIGRATVLTEVISQTGLGSGSFIQIDGKTNTTDRLVQFTVKSSSPLEDISLKMDRTRRNKCFRRMRSSSKNSTDTEFVFSYKITSSCEIGLRSTYNFDVEVRYQPQNGNSRNTSIRKKISLDLSKVEANHSP